MKLEELRDKLLRLRNGSAFKECPIMVIDTGSGVTFNIKDVVFDPCNNGTVYLKVKMGLLDDYRIDAPSDGGTR